MSSCNFPLFPRKDKSNRSQNISVGCGEFVMVEGYCMPEGVCIKFNKVVENPCKCEYNEKPFCIGKKQVGLDSTCTTALLTMPGCYVAYICGAEDCEEDFRVRGERIKCLDNLSVTLQGVALGV